jgi:hypothetical protein
MTTELVLVGHGCRLACDTLLSQWDGHLRAGLFTADVQPNFTVTIPQLQPASFAGYIGLQPVLFWAASWLVGIYAQSQAMPIQWLGGGPGIAEVVFGYYVVDDAGLLVWAERSDDLGTVMGPIGTQFTVTPRYKFRSQYLS